MPLQNSGDLKKPVLQWLPYQEKKFEGIITGNYGVICGKTSGNLFVVDLDSVELYPLFEAFTNQTLTVKTGKGYHFYFRTEESKMPRTFPAINKQGLKMDLRSQGAYVVGPGSKHESGAIYTIVSSTTDIMSIDPQIIKKILTEGGFEVHEQYAPPINEIVKFVPIGQRNNATFKYAAHLIGNLDLPDDMVWSELLRWSKQLDFQCPESELRSVFESAKKRVKRPNQTIPIKEALERAKSLNMTNMREITAKFENQNITFDAFIAVMYPHKTITYEETFTCMSCDAEKTKTSENYENVKPAYCVNCKQTMVGIKSSKKTIDVRTLMLQEFPEEAENNSPVRFMAKVKGADVTRLFIGQRKRFTGKFTSKQDKDKEENTPIILIERADELGENEDVEITLDVLQKIKKDIDESFIENKLVKSFAPDIEGRDEAKEIMLYAIVGGVRVGSRRGDINVAFVGNPGKAKSELLKKAVKITFKSTYVNGRSGSAAGIVYGMAKMPDGTMAPQAGPMVTNSGKNDDDAGFVMLDEADKMKREDRYGLLETMEQQTASLIKVGVNISEVSAKTSVISACNPHFGRWDFGMSIMDNLQPLEKPFIDRFDMIYPIISTTRELSSKIAKHIVNQGKGEPAACYMDETTLKYYLKYVRKLKPILSDEASNEILSNYEKTLDLMEKSADVLYTEERQLIGVIRLATARAKLLMKDRVDIHDVRRIIYLSNRCLEEFHIKPQEGLSHFSSETKKESEQHAFLTVFKSLEDQDKEVTKSSLEEALKVHPQFKDKNISEIIGKALGKQWNSIYNPHGTIYKRL